MADCYSCKITLTKSNHSWEHIIPSALGASLKSRRLICRNCNEKAGGGIDKALVDYCRPWIKKYEVQADRISKLSKIALIPCNPPEINLEQIKQAVIKICTNFYYWKNKSVAPFSTAVCKEQFLNLSANLPNEKPVHIVIIAGYPGLNRLISYVELFSEIGFLVTHSDHCFNSFKNHQLIYNPIHKELLNPLPETETARIFDEVLKSIK